jgi:ATP phosphoribosyltransferase regulatory subunit
VDQLSGRTLGVRADITPQVARIDAHLLNRKGVTRLCYAGSVLRTLPDAMNHTREPLQIGAEVYGSARIESDIEVQQLMLRALAASGIRQVHLDIGHVGIFRSLISRGRVDTQLESELFRATQAKDVPALKELTAGLRGETRVALVSLPQLYGGADVLARARRILPSYPEIRSALRDLAALSEELQDGAHIRCFDLAELRGYHYHTGVVFAAYAEGRPNALAQGGRYDEIGKAFGRARPATGFSADLRDLAALQAPERRRAGVLAPYAPHDASLQRRIASLRDAGTRVIVDLPGQGSARNEPGYDRRLVRRTGKWVIERIEVQERRESKAAMRDF